MLYFLRESVPNKPLPDDLIDTNVRIDYGKLRHLLLVNQRVGTNARRLNGNFDLLRHIVGEGRAAGDVQVSFPLDRLDQRENFLLPAALPRIAQHPERNGVVLRLGRLAGQVETDECVIGKESAHQARLPGLSCAREDDHRLRRRALQQKRLYVTIYPHAPNHMIES